MDGELLIADKPQRSCQNHQAVLFDVRPCLKQHGFVIHDLSTERVNRFFKFFFIVFFAKSLFLLSCIRYAV